MRLRPLLVELFRSNDFGGVYRLDKELEFTVGQKERCIGAFRQHIKDHNCSVSTGSPPTPFVLPDN